MMIGCSLPREAGNLRVPRARNVTMLLEPEDRWRCAVDVAPVAGDAEQGCRPLEGR